MVHEMGSRLRFVARHEAFGLAPALASAIRVWQLALYDPQQLFAPGDRVWLDSADAGPAILDTASAERLNRETIEQIEALVDPGEAWPPELPPCGVELVAEPDCANMRGLGAAMKRHLRALAAASGMREVLVAPLVRMSVLNPQNRHPPVARAMARLRDEGFDTTGGLVAIGPVEVVADLLGSLFWVARCNASAPQLFIGAPGSDWSAQLCRYANLHFTPCGERDALAVLLRRSGFVLPPDGQCSERFSRRAAVAGRRLELGP